MQATLEIFQERRQGVRTEQVRAIVAKIKVNDISYSLIESKDQELEWYQDSQIINVQEEMKEDWKNKKQVNYNTIFADIKKHEDQYVDVIQQYEDRMVRLK